MDARAYQLEMFQQSRQRNVIVAVRHSISRPLVGFLLTDA
jgi:hypothetical protein